MISPAAHFLNCAHIGRSQTIEAIIRFKVFSGKRFEIFTLRTSEEAIRRCSEKQVLKPICATIRPVLHFYFAD